MSQENLSAEERLNIIFGKQIHFDKLKKKTGVLNGALPVQAASAFQPPTPSVLPKVQAEKGIKSDIASEDGEESLDRRRSLKKNRLRYVTCRLISKL